MRTHENRHGVTDTLPLDRRTVTQRELSLTGGIRMSSAKMDCEL
jgi:hypothetical protein